MCARQCCSGARCNRIVRVYRVGFGGLIFYILMAFSMIDLFLWDSFTYFTHDSFLYFLNLLGVLSLSALYQTNRQDPGFLEEDWDANVAPTGMADWNLCKVCSLTQPGRSYHCWQVNRCVIRYDHFCPFADAPIGFFNYKYYFLLLIYGSMSGLTIMFLCIATIAISLFTYGFVKEILTGIPYLVWPLLAATVFLLSGLIPLLVHHLKLLPMNFSTKEYFDWKRDHDNREPQIQDSKWNLGTLGNLKQVMGPTYLQWWNPWVKGPVISGTNFPYGKYSGRKKAL